MRRLDVIAALVVATVSSAIVTWWGIRHAFPLPADHSDSPRCLR